MQILEQLGRAQYTQTVTGFKEADLKKRYLLLVLCEVHMDKNNLFI